MYQAPPKPAGSELAPKGTAQPVTDARMVDQASVPAGIPSGTATDAQAPAESQVTDLSPGDKAAIGSGAALAGGATVAGGIAAASTTSEAKKKKNKKKNEKKKAKKKAERVAAAGGAVTGDADGDDDDEDDDESSSQTGTTTPATASAFATPALDASNQLGDNTAAVAGQPVSNDSAVRNLDAVDPVPETQVTNSSMVAPISSVQNTQVTDPTVATPVAGAAGTVPSSGIQPPTTAQGPHVDQPERVLVAEYDAKDPSHNFQADPAFGESDDRGSNRDGAGITGNAALGTAVGAAAGAAGAVYAGSQFASAPKIDASNPSVQAFREASHEADVASAQTFVTKEQEGPVTTTTTVTEIVYEEGHADATGASAGVSSKAAAGTEKAPASTEKHVTTAINDDGVPIAKQGDIAQVTGHQLLAKDGTPIDQTADISGIQAAEIPQNEFGVKPAGATEHTEQKHESLSHKAAGAVAGAVAGATALGGAAVLAVKHATGVDIAPEPAPVSCSLRP